jgi:hypothetical protein
LASDSSSLAAKAAAHLRHEARLCCVETISGRWERVRIDSTYSTQIDDLGSAPTTAIR